MNHRQQGTLFTPKVVDFAKQFLDASHWFTAYNRGKVFKFVVGGVKHSINLDDSRNFFAKSATSGGKGYFAPDGAKY